VDISPDKLSLNSGGTRKVGLAMAQMPTGAMSSRRLAKEFLEARLGKDQPILVPWLLQNLVRVDGSASSAASGRARRQMRWRLNLEELVGQADVVGEFPLRWSPTAVYSGETAFLKGNDSPCVSIPQPRPICTVALLKLSAVAGLKLL
jgi:hypothetical protein